MRSSELSPGTSTSEKSHNTVGVRRLNFGNPSSVGTSDSSDSSIELYHGYKLFETRSITRHWRVDFKKNSKSWCFCKFAPLGRRGRQANREGSSEFGAVLPH